MAHVLVESRAGRTLCVLANVDPFQVTAEASMSSKYLRYDGSIGPYLLNPIDATTLHWSFVIIGYDFDPHLRRLLQYAYPHGTFWLFRLLLDR